MAPFNNGDLLRLPTEKEIFGKNYYGECESLCEAVGAHEEAQKPYGVRRH